MFKNGFPKILSTQSFSKEKSPTTSRSFRGSHFCVLRRENGGEKKTKTKTRWEKAGEVTKAGIKKGLRVAFKFRGPTGLHRAIPSGPGFGILSRRAQNRSCRSPGIGARERVRQLGSARLGWALPPGCEQPRQRRLPSRSALTPATRVSF